MKIKKSTKRFTKNHLQQQIKKRRNQKQWQQQKGKKRTGEETTKEFVDEAAPVNEELETTTAGEHKDQLNRLQEQDPEFYEYLKKNDSKLLNFAADFSDDEDALSAADDEEQMGDLEDDNEQEMADSDAEDAEEEEEDRLTAAHVRQWKESVQKTHSLKALRRILTALQQVVQANDPDKKEESVIIVDEELFAELISVSIDVLPDVFHHHTKFDPEQKKLPTKNPNWPRMEPFARSYLKSISQLLRELTDINMLEHVIKGLDKSYMIVYFACFAKKKVAKEFVKRLLEIWSMLPATATADEDENGQVQAYESLKVASFMGLHKLCSFSSQEFQQLCFKGALKAYLGVCKNTTVHTLPYVNLLSNCLIELFGLNQTVTYQLAFSSIRQLAMTLRNAIVQQSQDTSRTLCTWQTVHSIRLWARCLAFHHTQTATKANASSKQSPLHQLIFPLTQVSLGIAKFLPSQQFYPMRLHILRSLNDLSQRTQVFIPITGQLLEILSTLAHESHKCKPGSLKPLEFHLNLRAPKAYLHTRVYLENSAEEAGELMVECLAGWSKSIGFPEMVIPVLLGLKRVKKEGKNAKLCKVVSGLVERVNASREHILQRRANVTFAPIELNKCVEFEKGIEQTPLLTYLAQMKKVKEQKMQMLNRNNKN